MSSGGATDINRTLPMADARYVKAKTCVWWDIENCQVPRSCDPYSIARNISKSLADMNYKGVVTISAYGDTTQISSSVQQALSSTGIALNHVPAGIKDASDKKILVDMLIWGYDNPPPANHLLISGDRDFSNALHQLSMRRYNILLAQPEKASQALVSAAKTVWLWTSLVVGGMPFEKLPSFQNTSTNRKSNIVTESNSIVYSSQPDDFNLKNNNNGNFINGNKAKQISKTQSQPVISASSSNGNEDVYKQSIGSSDSSNHNQENDLQHLSYMFVSTTAELGSNCITSNSNSNIVTESSRILYSSQPDDINQKNNDNGNFDNHKKEEQISRTQSQPVISTSSSTGNEEGNKQSIGSSDSPDSDQRNDSKHPILSTQPEKVSQALVSAAKTVWQWTSLVVGGRPVENIPNLHDTLANSISNNEMQGNSISYSSRPDDLNQKSSNNGNFDNHNKAKHISKSQSQPIMSTSPSNGNEEGSKLSIGSSDSSNLNNGLRTPELCSNCIPKSQQLVDSDKSNAPCGPTSNYTPKIKQKMVKNIPSNTTMSTTNSSGAQKSTITEMTKVDRNSALSRPSALVVPESGNPYLSTNPTSANIQLGPDMASSNHKNELTQPSHAYEAKEGGNISITFGSFSMESSSQVLPESNSSNAPHNNANTMFTNNGSNCEVGTVIKKNRNISHKQKQNVVCSQSCHQSTDLSGSNCNSSSSSSPVPTIRRNDYQSVPPTMPDVSFTTPIPDISASSSSSSSSSIGSLDDSDINQKNDLKQPSHTCVLTVPDLDSSCITSNTNPTPCIPKSQRLGYSGKINAPSRPTSNCKPKIKQKGGNLSNTSSSYSTKSSSPALPKSNPTNASKINATVKIAIKKNRKKNHKQQQNQCSQSCFQSRNLSGSNYNHSSSSSTVPTIRPNNYQAVHSTMPGVSLPTPIPDISRLNISDTANFLQGQIGVILEALNILKSEKIPPTEANVSDCIRYGNISLQNFNVKMALDYTVEHQVVVMHKLGNFMPLYVGRNDTLWNCVNIMDSSADHVTENFDAVLKFLSSAKGRSAILSSQCRYQAALILRELCLKNIVLGEILQLSHIIIQFRKWIIPHASGWQPLAVTVFINSDEVSTSSPSTTFGWG